MNIHTAIGFVLGLIWFFDDFSKSIEDFWAKYFLVGGVGGYQRRGRIFSNFLCLLGGDWWWMEGSARRRLILE